MVFRPLQKRSGFFQTSISSKMEDDSVQAMKDIAARSLLTRIENGDPVPATITLEQILAALKIIAAIIPVIDGLIPYFVRWWKELFGSKEERQAVRAYKILKAAQKVLDDQQMTTATGH